MRSTKLFLAALALLFLTGGNLWAQAPQITREQAEELKKRYPNDDVVILQNETYVEIKNGKDGPVINIRYVTVKLLLKEKGAFSMNTRISYSDYFNKLGTVTPVLYRSSKGKYSTKSPGLSISSGSDSRHFHDDTRNVNVLFFDVKELDVSSVSYTEAVNDPHFMHAFYFQLGYPVLKNVFEVTWPDGIEMDFLQFHTQNKQIRKEQTSKGSKRTVRYTTDTMSAIAFESNAPNLRYYAAHVLPVMKSYSTKKAGQQMVYSDVKQLHSYYNGLVSEVSLEPTDELKAITADLVSGKQDAEAAKAIYYWVQEHVRYVAFEDGLGGFVPRDATAVTQKKYGDCKDMANLLVVMLRQAGFDAWRTWIGSRDIPYTYEEMPTVNVDNHMIATMRLKDEMVFLDATGGLLPLGLPTPMIQGKEALVSFTPDSFAVIKVPQVKASTNVLRDSTRIRIENGLLLKGAGSNTYTGLHRFEMAYALSGENEKKRQEALEESAKRGNNKCKVTNLNYTGLGSRDSDLVVRYDFEIPDYIVQDGQKLYLNMSLDRTLRSSSIDTAQRKLDLKFDYAYETVRTIELEVPRGYTVESLPKSSSFQDEEFSCRIDYSMSGNKVLVTQHITINTLLLKTEKFPRWNEMIKGLQESYRNTVILQKTL